ncbi:1-(5-phosphoribosyl)-5-[(5-phosphoribosylamino)methylideneamino]imidazole-4-carboxamide isomerase [Mariprofundus ferrooxydans]|uniref:1-(5-phosphoribosyl)-5-[(5-phosphoribosylamino)methylideneamino] imidazole-4-carboxamide isomerase n=1 Tax=Mariprofundus ferrooxydans PV-1 TaxID=314345 RepID=Q0EX95_9PROT|nr:1-(5-phosphoribosyl)-5-[(5-phosphoribosylamino)methylideneamino]imidazole-4-carboxamide isomerase [Mariprofundus ferrooxydans]EAU53895.1 1-(5-phosphoribosyl)-5-[(5-phosphoribosylamino)methylideneamino] imidazole-4-carboxamide isomerase [Mariprofundus ferrooxydans PV-1]KON48311.1 1-(5-phosphoribosyl)-5-[(5-phosphoribosylamino)methylideneamino] imidazole-4-carboxamide isomerase [Mariprofundus ferrooxydans]
MNIDTSFELIPAIDLKGGHCVRLKQGRMDDATDYGDDPAAMALHWQRLGARRMHVVDLDGAFAGKPANREAIRAICEALTIPVQLGGGLRDLSMIEGTLNLGVERVILGSVAVSNPSLVEEACKAFPGRVCVGIDAKAGMVAVHGWDDVTDVSAVNLARQFEDAGVSAIIYTDISRDGMLSGPNIEETANLARAVSIPVIVSGGVATMADVTACAAHVADGICGAITGRAIYEGTLDFAAAMKVSG